MTYHRPHPGTPLDGLLNLDKPIGLTSARALDQVRAVTGQRKSGHAGTLDPGATGVLIICFGRATKLVERFMDLPKVYRATARLDVTSDSLDADSELLPVSIPSVPDFDAVSRVLASMIGEIQQAPPNISAVKVGGVPAYKRARRGEVLHLQPRPVVIYSMHLRAFEWPTLDFEVCCGRGTYIRSLIRDIGMALGTGGCLTSLIRERVGPFTRNAAWTLDALRALPDFHDAIFDLESARTLLDGSRIHPDASPQADQIRDRDGAVLSRFVPDAPSSLLRGWGTDRGCPIVATTNAGCPILATARMGDGSLARETSPTLVPEPPLARPADPTKCEHP